VKTAHGSVTAIDAFAKEPSLFASHLLSGLPYGVESGPLNLDVVIVRDPATFRFR
jgi:hypothetical protein